MLVSQTNKRANKPTGRQAEDMGEEGRGRGKRTIVEAADFEGDVFVGVHHVVVGPHAGDTTA